MIDAHLHLDRYPLENIDQMVTEWRNAGIVAVVAVSTDLKSAYRILDLKQRYPDFIRAALGFHPEQPIQSEQPIFELMSLIESEKASISAIGEVGLPHYEAKALGEKQFAAHIEVLELFMKLGKEQNLPLALHAVHDKANIVFSMLKKENIRKAHFHWLKASPKTIMNIIEANYVISVTPEVCYRVRDQNLANLVPLKQLLIETDGPWPFVGPFEGKQTTPLYLNSVVKKIAEVKKTTAETVMKQTTENARTFYK